MAVYAYIARSRRGEKIRGQIDANDEREVAHQLRAQGLILISARRRALSSEKAISEVKLFKPRIKSKHIIIMFRQFATLINAGLPIVQALDILVNQTQNASLKEIIIQVKADIEAGSSLSDALLKYPKKFPPLICNMIKAGEVGGVLDLILTRLANYLEETDNMKERIKTAMRYPIFVLIMAGGLVFALMFFILPRMEELFREAFQANLPALTQFFLDLSRLLREKFYIVLLIVGIIALIYWLIKRSNRGSYWLDTVKLKLPVLGKLFHKMALSRFARTLATLSNSGVPILESLELTGKTAENKVIERAVEEARSSLKEGETISAPLKRYSVFPPLATSMISVGEQTGSLDEMLDKVADFYDQEVQTIIDSLASLLEPLLMVFLGATVGIIVVAMYLPYFTMFKYIGG